MSNFAASAVAAMCFMSARFGHWSTVASGCRQPPTWWPGTCTKTPSFIWGSGLTATGYHGTLSAGLGRDHGSFQAQETSPQDFEDQGLEGEVEGEGQGKTQGQTEGQVKSQDRGHPVSGRRRARPAHRHHPE